MLVNLICAMMLEIGPFYEQRTDFTALRPVWSEEATTTDVLWPIFTAHKDWWRFCFFTHYQEYGNEGWQFEIMPFWCNGEDYEKGKYWALFPLYGYHPHIALMYDLEFCLWPVWTRYKMPRADYPGGWMTSNAVLFPFFSWRDDGSWGVWPFYGISHNRESDHQYALWPFFTWAEYREDRDTAGAGDSWMFWPFYGQVNRTREKQWLCLPPFISKVETADGWRLRAPWPIFEIEEKSNRKRLSIFPFYERETYFDYKTRSKASTTTRFLWRVVELYPDETRVFPFYVKNGTFLRIWPFYEKEVGKDLEYSRVLSLFPIRWVDAIDRNWSKFWTFYEAERDPVCTSHSLFWGIIHWRTIND